MSSNSDPGTGEEYVEQSSSNTPIVDSVEQNNGAVLLEIGQGKSKLGQTRFKLAKDGHVSASRSRTLQSHSSVNLAKSGLDHPCTTTV